jgi:hypothetical protein
MKVLDFKYDDGGRSAAGYKGKVGDCVIRSLAIMIREKGSDLSAGEIYSSVYKDIYAKQKAYFNRKRKPGRKTMPSPREFVYKQVTKKVMEEHRGKWEPTMQIGSGCQVHLRVGELPSGLLVASVSKHVVAIINGVVFDTHNPCREGTRCVYGYWKF